MLNTPMGALVVVVVFVVGNAFVFFVGPATMPRGKVYWRHQEDQSEPKCRG